MALRDLVDCCQILSRRLELKQTKKYDGKLVVLATDVMLKFERVGVLHGRGNHFRAWSTLFYSARRLSKYMEGLYEKNWIQRDELDFTLECIEEIFKYIRRHFAKTGAPFLRSA